MNTKEKLQAGAARLAEEAAQTGQVVIRAPVLLVWAECAIRFLLGAVLAGAEVFGAYAPFGVALVGASGSGLGGFSALLGACFGYLSFRGFTESLRFVASAILTFSVAFAFYDFRFYRKAWFMPLATALLCGATGFVYLSDRGWLAGDVIFFFTELVFAGAAVYFYRAAFDAWDDRTREPDLPRMVGLFALGLTLLMALSRIFLLGDISLGRLAAGLLVMIAACRGGAGTGAAVGVCAGLAMDLTSGAGPYYSMTYGFSGLVTGAFRKESRLMAALAFVLSNAACVLWTWDSGARISGLYEVFIASVILVVLPEGVLRRADALLLREPRGETTQRAAQYVRARLDKTAGAFRELHACLRGAFHAPQENGANVALVFDRAANRVCRRCALRDNCWQRDYVTTFNALNDATAAMVDRGRALPGDFPAHFSNRCLHFPEFLAAVSEELAVYLCRRQYQSRLWENRQAVCRQYAELGGLLSRAAAALDADLPPDPEREKRLRRHLAAHGLEGTVACYYDENGRLRAETPDHLLLRQPQELEALSALLELPLRPPEEEGGRLVFTQAEPLMAVAGVAARRRDGETVSGDAGAWFRRTDGTLYVLLCDGMGSGPAANRESTAAVRLLERFLRAEVEPEAALRVLNSALYLRSEADGGFTTVDLLELNLFTGEAALYKLGAAPTYVRKREAVSRFTGVALPAGLADGSGTRPDVIRLQLEAGDCVVLLSDGVAAGGDDGWLRECLGGFDGASPKELARRLIDESSGKSQAADDRTAMVVRLAPRRAG